MEIEHYYPKPIKSEKSVQQYLCQGPALSISRFCQTRDAQQKQLQL